MLVIKETDKRFYIKESTVPNGGKGLFAKEFLRQGDHLEIIGIYVQNGSISDNCTTFATDYKFMESDDSEAKHKLVPFGFGGMVNHGRNKNEKNAILTFVSKLKKKKNPHASGLIYKFTRDIKKDEEILGDYGGIWKKILEVKETDKLDKDWKEFLSLGLYNLHLLEE